jgi:hypothetical protein
MLYSVMYLHDHRVGHENTDVRFLGVAHQIHLIYRYKNHQVCPLLNRRKENIIDILDLCKVT